MSFTGRTRARIKRRIQISELEELRLKAYHNASIYKKKDEEML
jgi:hypothetical protein